MGIQNLRIVCACGSTGCSFYLLLFVFLLWPNRVTKEEEEMERALDKEEDPAVDIERMKKSKGHKQEEEEEREETGFVHLDENLLFEVFKHVDARSLAKASCVNKQWHKTCQDKRLWEIICTRHFANTGTSPPQLRSAALALGGFRGLQSDCFSNSPTQWGKDDVQLYLSLLSIRHFEKMNASHRGKRWT